VNLELSLNVVIVFPSAIHLPLKENVDKVQPFTASQGKIGNFGLHLELTLASNVSSEDSLSHEEIGLCCSCCKHFPLCEKMIL
jgi:hypothetical protein